jgi:LuxR family maltose regulon positive regulatory protein
MPGVCENFDKLYPLIGQIAKTHPQSLALINSMVMLDCRLKLSELPDRARVLPAAAQKTAHTLNPTFTFHLPLLHRCVRDFYLLTDESLHRRVAAFSSHVTKENADVMYRAAEAGLLMEQNRLREALAVCVSLRHSLCGGISPEFVYAVHVLTAQLYHLLRYDERCEAALWEAKDYIARHNCAYLLRNLSAFEARLRIWSGDGAAAGEWLETCFDGENSFGEFYKIYRNFTTVRAYILLGETQKAAAALKTLKALALAYDRPQDAMEADVLLCVAEWAAGQKKQARARLQDTLAQMSRHGFVRVLADEGKAALPVLSAVLKTLKTEKGAPDAYYRFAREVWRAAGERAKHLPGILCSRAAKSARLSRQQARVLALLAKGLKNAQIAGEMGVSLNTVRTHTKLAYQKLEVNNAADAVAKARQAGFIA